MEAALRCCGWESPVAVATSGEHERKREPVAEYNTSLTKLLSFMPVIIRGPLFSDPTCTQCIACSGFF